jgi:hypothetical protein
MSDHLSVIKQVATTVVQTQATVTIIRRIITVAVVEGQMVVAIDSIKASILSQNQ